MLKNDMCITEIGQAVSSYEAPKIGRRILLEVEKCRFPTFRTPIGAENDVIVEQ